MRYYCLLLTLSSLLLYFSATDAQAQTTTGLVKAGAGVSNLLSSKQNELDYFKPGSRLAYQLGVGARRQFSDQFGLQAEALYLIQGATYGKDDSVSMTFKSAGLAVLALYKPLPVLEFEVGVLPNYSLSVTNEDGHDFANIWDRWRFDIGLLLGTRFHISENIAINPRFSYGLLPLKTTVYQRDAQGHVSELTAVEHRYHHINAQLTLEYIFDL